MAAVTLLSAEFVTFYELRVLKPNHSVPETGVGHPDVFSAAVIRFGLAKSPSHSSSRLPALEAQHCEQAHYYPIPLFLALLNTKLHLRVLEHRG